MKSKLQFLTQTSLNRKIKTKWFVIVNLLLAIAIMGIINIDSIIVAFGGDFNEKQEIYVVDNTNASFDVFREVMNNSNASLTEHEESNYEITLYDKDIDSAQKEIEENKDLWVVIFDEDHDNYLKAKVISDGYIDTIDYQTLSSAIMTVKTTLAISKSDISPEELESIYAPITIDRVILDDTKKTEGESESMMMTLIFPIVILPFFLLTIFLVQMIGAEVNEEKATRGMEMIISNVSPKTHFFSKILAGNIFVLLQSFLLVLYAAIGMIFKGFIGGYDVANGVGSYVGSLWDTVISSGMGDKLIYILPLTLILMILTFVAYSLLAGVLASMTTNMEDFQQLQTPIMMLTLVSYYLAMMSSMFDGSMLIRIASYIPFISAILSPSLLVLGQIGIIDVLISIVLTIGVIYLLVKYGLRIYKVGILNYSSKGLWKKMFKAIKE